MLYRNGYIPKEKLVVFNVGWNSTDGNWYWGLPPATYARHNRLIQLAREHTGGTLTPSQGWSTYRPYAAQVIAKKVHGIYAATPGTSSHGGYWEGKDVMAIDYHNWDAVYAKYGTGARARFYLDVRRAGLTPGMIEPGRGYPDEPWHVVDFSPWSGGSAAGGEATPIEGDGDMDADQSLKLNAVYSALFGPANVDATTMTWKKPFGEDIGVSYYGLLDLTIYSQGLIAKQTGQIAGISEAVSQLAAKTGAVLDIAAVEAAAERGAREALNDLTITIQPGAE